MTAALYVCGGMDRRRVNIICYSFDSGNFKRLK